MVEMLNLTTLFHKDMLYFWLNLSMESLNNDQILPNGMSNFFSKVDLFTSATHLQDLLEKAHLIVI